MTCRSLYFAAPGAVEVRESPLPQPGPGQLVVETLASAISAGTEMLFYRGQVPEALLADATLAALAATGYPLKYGYAAVGRVLACGPGVDPAWGGRLVFAFNPHESHFLAAPGLLHPLPPGITPEQALFLANMETALTLVQDGRPLIGEQVLVCGQGIVGLLLTSLLARFPLAGLVTLDSFPARRLASENLGAHLSLDPQTPDAAAQIQAALQQDQGSGEADLAYEVSGNPAALNLALAVTGFHGRVVIGSWYGTKPASLDLGGSFHRSRIRLFSSQVSTLDPELTGRWDQRRRLAWVWRLLQDLAPDRLISHTFPLSQAAQAYELLDRHPGDVLQVVLTYA